MNFTYEFMCMHEFISAILIILFKLINSFKIQLLSIANI